MADIKQLLHLNNLQIHNVPKVLFVLLITCFVRTRYVSEIYVHRFKKSLYLNFCVLLKVVSTQLQELIKFIKCKNISLRERQCSKFDTFLPNFDVDT